MDVGAKTQFSCAQSDRCIGFETDPIIKKMFGPPLSFQNGHRKYLRALLNGEEPKWGVRFSLSQANDAPMTQ